MSDILTIDDRTIRARKFASQIMAIIQDCVSDKVGAESRLIDAGRRPASALDAPRTTPKQEAIMPHYTLTLSGRMATALASLCIAAGFILGRLL